VQLGRGAAALRFPDIELCVWAGLGGPGAVGILPGGKGKFEEVRRRLLEHAALFLHGGVLLLFFLSIILTAFLDLFQTLGPLCQHLLEGGLQHLLLLLPLLLQLYSSLSVKYFLQLRLAQHVQARFSVPLDLSVEVPHVGGLQAGVAQLPRHDQAGFVRPVIFQPCFK